jgi:hypothetical protein
MANSDKNIRITTSKNKTTLPNIVFTGSSAGTSVLTLEVRDDNTVAFTGTDGDVFSLDYNLSTGTIWSVNDKSGTPFLRASAGGTIGIAEFGTGVLVGIGQTNPRYKLDVQGWAGFASTGDGSYTVLVENGLTTGNNALSIRAANALRFYNSGNTFYTGFIGAQSGVNTTYTLPPTSPATGTSVLQSTSTGILTWVPMVAGSSSGTVNSGTATYAAYYASTSTAVSDNANLQFTGTGLSVGGNVQSASTLSGSLQVRGGFGITGNAFIGGTTVIANTTVSIGTNSGALVVNGGVGIGGSLFTGTGTPSSISGVVLSNNAITASTLNKVTVSAPASSATLTLADTSTLATSGAFSLTLTTTALTNVTFPSGTKTLVATDVTSLSSLNTIGTITSGTWAGTPITTLYGGTGFNSYSVGDILYAATGSSLAKLPANANVGYVLTSNGANAAPSYQAVPSSSATSVAVTPTVLNQSFFVTTVSTSSGTGLGLSTITSFVINPSTNIVTLSGLAVTSLTNSSSTQTGALTVFGGLGLSANAFIGGTTVVANNTVSIGTNSGALVVNGGVGIGGSLFTGTGTPSSVSGVVFNNGTVTSGTWNGAVIAPQYGGTGQNYSASSGILKYTAGTASLVTAPSGAIVGTTDAQALSNKTSYNNVAITAPATNATLTLADTTTFATSGAFNLTLTTLAATNVTLPRAGTLTSSGNDLSVFASTTSAQLANLISDETGTAGKLVFSTTPTFTTSVVTDSASFAVFNTTATTINAFGAATTLSVGASTGTFTHNSTDNTTLPSTGSLVILGGVGIGKSVNVGGSVNIFNGSNYSGFKYTGSAVANYTLPTNVPQSAVGTSVLASATDGTMRWVGMSAGGSASPGGSDSQVQYNSGGSFAGATGMTWDNGNNLLTLSATSTLINLGTQAALRLVNNNLTNGTDNQKWSPALELIGRSAAGAGFGLTYNNRFTTEVVPVGPNDYRAYRRTKYSYDLITGSPSFNNDLFRIHSTLGVGFGASNSNSNAISYFRVNTLQSGDVAYILPVGLPGSGTSVLQSDTSGNLTWVGAATAGGSGTVNSGTGGSFTVYGTTGTAVIGTNLVTFAGSGVSVNGLVDAASTTSAGLSVRGGIAITGNAFIGGTTVITNTTPSNSTGSGALIVAGSVGVGGSLYIGGQINQTYQPTTGAAIDHALFMQSNPVATTVGALVQIGSANKWDGTTAGFFTGSASGTYLGINAPSGNVADFLNFQQNGQPIFKVGLGGTNFQVGLPVTYTATDVLASFASSTNSYNQVILQNKSTGSSASADFVINNDVSTDSSFYGNFGMNSSGWAATTAALNTANAVYLTSTSGPLVLGTTTLNPIRFAVNGGLTDVMYISESGTAISVFTNFGLRSASDLRFWNVGNTFYAAIQGGGNTANYTLTMPTAPVATGSSLIIVGSDSNMYFVAPGSGIAFSNAASTGPLIRAKHSLNLQFASGYTPVAAGADSAVIRVPESASDGTSILTYNLRRFQVRVETPSAGSSRIQLEKSSTDTGAFTISGLGSSFISGSGATIAGAGIYLTSTTFASGTFVTSGNLLRLNWTLLNATHANFSVNLILEEV